MAVNIQQRSNRRLPKAAPRCKRSVCGSEICIRPRLGAASAWVAMILAQLAWQGAAAASPTPEPPGRHEASMLKSLHDCPLCREHEPCILDCRFAQKRGWKECLEECMKDNPMVRDLMIKLSDVGAPRDSSAGHKEKDVKAGVEEKRGSVRGSASAGADANAAEEEESPAGSITSPILAGSSEPGELQRFGYAHDHGEEV
eukprot:TRINITY_DN94352_c0_g1_i1.p1 TRINITY_DN94352_c0_g1~~TRINITY_DN94352_c0_g1_i1.p1  ORF type:complete len:200 (-),score=37.34 TRINITY_DN94352_c0_g1_i1:4-603(-)